MQYLQSVLVLLASLLTFGFTAPPPAAETEVVIGIPGTVTPTTATTVLRSVNSMLKSFPPGTRLTVYDAEEQQRIAILEVPKSKVPNIRRKAIQKQARPLLAHLSRKGSVREGEADRLRIPAFLSLVESSLTSKSASVRVILFGSPFYAVEGSPAAFRKGEVLSDGFILASSVDSAFGTADRKKPLDGVVVDFCYLSEQVFAHGQREKRSLERFYAAYLDCLGSTLSTFSSSSDIVIERALEGTKDCSTQSKIDPKDTKMVVRKIAPKGRKVEVQRTDAKAPVEMRAKLKKAADAAPLPAKGKFTVAAFWPTASGSKVDVDVYLQARPGGPEISFRQKVTADGELLRDVQNGSRSKGSAWRASFEAVEVKETLLEGSSAWLNLFAYQGPGPIEGIVRVALGKQFVDQPFAFERGVQGSSVLLDQRKRARSQQWIKVDLQGAFEKLSR